MARSVNKVILVGNLTRDPELRYTPQGHAVCSFGVATNREWKTDGDTKEATEFHNIVSWNKLAELCAQLLKKGTKVYLEGRLQTRDWQTEDGQKRYKTEVVIEEMVILSSRKKEEHSADESQDRESEAGVGEEISSEDIDISEETPF